MAVNTTFFTENRTGQVLLAGLGCLVAALVVGFCIAKGGIAVAGLLIAGPPALLFVGILFNRPHVGIYTCLILSFFLFSHSIGDIIAHIVGPSLQLGLLLDGCLLVSLLGVLIRAKQEDWARLNNPVVYLLLLWLLYTIFELINPEAISKEPWFPTVRGFSVYWFEVTIIGYICLRKPADLNRFVNIWMTGCVVLALWSFKQHYIGLSTEEQFWIDTVAASTHIINGVLRTFSLCPDAGQFGAVMAQATLYALIRLMDEPSKLRKIGYGVMTAMFFWGFALAGSRGPLAIIGAGFAVYLVLKRNIVVLVIGGTVAGLAFGMLKYTTIGQDNDQIRRLRSALDPEDPSLQLRLSNQRLFADFLATRPFGIGLGLAGDSGKKYWSIVVTQQGIDSWYVKIWVETGVIGLFIHAIGILTFGAIGFRKVFVLRDPKLRSVMSGLLCGYFGILVANYGNQIMGQKPTCFIIYTSILFFVQADHFAKEIEPAEPPNRKLT
jgi:hypothetical protein